jgi:integrase
MKPTHDPRTTPFIEKLADIRRIFLLLPLPLSVAYALGVLAGLRTGEIFALKWRHVDLAARRIHVRESVKGPLKDKDSRVVPILDPMLPILTEWNLKTGGEGLVIPPLRCDGKKIDKATPGNFLRPVLKALDLARPKGNRSVGSRRLGQGFVGWRREWTCPQHDLRDPRWEGTFGRPLSTPPLTQYGFQFPRSGSLDPPDGGCAWPKAPGMAAVERRASSPVR